MSAENHNPGSPNSGGTDGATEPSNNAPESVRPGVVASHGEREKRAYVAPVEIPKRHQRTNTIDMSKVRISPDMKVQQLDPRHMPTQKMDLPPGGIRPLPPPATAEVADAQSSRSGAVANPAAAASPGAVASPGVAATPGAAASPWSQNAGIDRSMLPSAAMAPQAPAQAARIPSMPPPRSQSRGGIGPGVWIGVVLVAALVGGGIALALRSSGSSGSADPVSSSAPIAITVPGTTSPLGSTDDPELEIVDPNSPEATDDAGAAASSTKSTTPRTTPRKTSPTTKSTAPAPAPAPTTTVRPRLFN